MLGLYFTVFMCTLMCDVWVVVCQPFVKRKYDDMMMMMSRSRLLRINLHFRNIFPTTSLCVLDRILQTLCAKWQTPAESNETDRNTAVTTVLTTSARNSLVVSLRSYQWPWSIHCLNSSIGGWAPYFSFCGMLRSSTNAMHFLPSGGPYTPFLRLVDHTHTVTVSVTVFCARNPNWVLISGGSKTGRLTSVVGFSSDGRLFHIDGPATVNFVIIIIIKSLTTSQTESHISGSRYKQVIIVSWSQVATCKNCAHCTPCDFIPFHSDRMYCSFIRQNLLNYPSLR